MNSLVFFLGAFLGLTSVAAGSFGAHALKKKLQQHNKEAVFDTGVRYQMYHALVLLIMAFLPQGNDAAAYQAVVAAFVFGVLTFSGSLYGLALKPSRWFAYMSPLGGLLLLLGWLGLLFIC